MTDTSLPSTMDARIAWDQLQSLFGYRHLAGLTLLNTHVLMLLGAYTSAIGPG